jgi:hypothetical protein
MTCYREFPDFPAAAMPALPAGWIDTSWHNDVCPSYTSPAGSVVWINYPDPADRDCADDARFLWCRLSDDGCASVEAGFDTWAEAYAHAMAQDAP